MGKIPDKIGGNLWIHGEFRGELWFHHRKQCSVSAGLIYKISQCQRNAEHFI